MELYSEELKILDRNTVQPMIDEMQEEIDAQKDILNLKDTQIPQQKQQIYALKQELEKLKKRSACS